MIVWQVLRLILQSFKVLLFVTQFMTARRSQNLHRYNQNVRFDLALLKGRVRRLPRLPGILERVKGIEPSS